MNMRVEKVFISKPICSNCGLERDKIVRLFLPDTKETTYIVLSHFPKKICEECLRKALRLIEKEG